MKELKTSITAVVALLILVFSLLNVTYIIVRYGYDATTRTQVITGLFGIITGVIGYYFGSMKSRANATLGTTTADITATVTTEAKTSGNEKGEPI